MPIIFSDYLKFYDYLIYFLKFVVFLALKIFSIFYYKVEPYLKENLLVFHIHFYHQTLKLNFLYFYIVRCLIEGLDVDEYDIQVHFHREPENWIDRD